MRMTGVPLPSATDARTANPNRAADRECDDRSIPAAIALCSERDYLRLFTLIAVSFRVASALMGAGGRPPSSTANGLPTQSRCAATRPGSAETLSWLNSSAGTSPVAIAALIAARSRRPAHRSDEVAENSPAGSQTKISG